MVLSGNHKRLRAANECASNPLRTMGLRVSPGKRLIRTMNPLRSLMRKPYDLCWASPREVS